MKSILVTGLVVFLVGVAGIMVFESYSKSRCEKQVEKIRIAAALSNNCEEDSDCATLAAECPFGCEGLLVHKREVSKIAELMSQRRKSCGTCMYDCYIPTKTVVRCRNSQCVRVEEQSVSNRG